MSNEPTRHAQKSTGVVTALQLLQCIKAGNDGLYAHGEACHDRASYSDAFVFTVSSVKRVRALHAATQARDVESITKLSLPGWVTNGSTSREACEAEDGMRDRYVRFAGVHRPLKGFWSLTYCAKDRLLAILALLPKTAEVAFCVALDAGTHEYLVRADCPMNFETYQGLHADHFVLRATYVERLKTKTVEFLIDVQIIPHNTARFGAPGSRF